MIQFFQAKVATKVKQNMDVKLLLHAPGNLHWRLAVDYLSKIRDVKSMQISIGKMPIFLPASMVNDQSPIRNQRATIEGHFTAYEVRFLLEGKKHIWNYLCDPKERHRHLFLIGSNLEAAMQPGNNFTEFSLQEILPPVLIVSPYTAGNP